MDEIDQIKFDRVRRGAEIVYKAIGEIWCPYFKEKIIFNAKGWEHLKFKTHGHARERGDQYVRFKLLYLAPEVLKISHAVQGVSQMKKMEFMNVNSRWEWVMKRVEFWEFIAVIDEVRVRVVIKQVEGGAKHFWSIIPFWKIDQTTRQRTLHGSHPDVD